MSHDEYMYAHDEQLFEAVVRHQRAVAAIVTRHADDEEPRGISVDHPATRAFRSLVAAAVVPKDRRRDQARRELARGNCQAARTLASRLVEAWSSADTTLRTVAVAEAFGWIRS